jgi:hypothetical protein
MSVVPVLPDIEDEARVLFLLNIGAQSTIWGGAAVATKVRPTPVFCVSVSGIRVVDEYLLPHLLLLLLLNCIFKEIALRIFV